jgi:hypothetical protein
VVLQAIRRSTAKLLNAFDDRERATCGCDVGADHLLVIDFGRQHRTVL